jgi:hypothetical protein
MFSFILSIHFPLDLDKCLAYKWAVCFGIKIFVVNMYLSFYLCNFLWFLTNWVLLQRERGYFSPTISSPLYIMIRCRLSNIVTIERKHSARWSCNNYQTHNDNKFIIPLPWWINRPTLFRNIHYTGSCNLGRFSNTPHPFCGPSQMAAVKAWCLGIYSL